MSLMPPTVIPFLLYSQSAFFYSKLNFFKFLLQFNIIPRQSREFLPEIQTLCLTLSIHFTCTVTLTHIANIYHVSRSCVV